MIRRSMAGLLIIFASWTLMSSTIYAEEEAANTDVTDTDVEEALSETEIPGELTKQKTDADTVESDTAQIPETTLTSETMVEESEVEDAELLNATGDTTWQADYDYTLSGRNIVLTKYNGDATDVCIPAIARISGAEYGVQLGSATGLNFDSKKIKNLSVESGVKLVKITFNSNSTIETIDLRGADSSEMIAPWPAQMFSCRNLKSVNLKGLNLSTIQDMSNWFYMCSKLESVDMSGVNAPNVTNMSQMFYRCKKLASLDLSGMIVDSVTDMSHMFEDCNTLSSLDMSGFNTANVTNMNHLFYGCSNLTDLDVSSFNTSNVTDMGYIFSGCDNLKGVDWHLFYDSKVSDWSYVFDDFAGLQEPNPYIYSTDSVIGKVGSVSRTAVKVANNIEVRATRGPIGDAVSNVTQFKGPDGNLYYAVDSDSVVTVYKTQNGNPISGTVTLEKKHPKYGTIICDSDENYYLVTGEDNEGDDSSVETIFISKYDRTGNHIKTVGDNGADTESGFRTKKPFAASNCDAAIYGDYLTVHYGRLMYNGHQSNSTLTVNCSDLSRVNLNYRIYQSHSFAQRVISTENGFVFLAQGDGNNRAFTAFCLDIVDGFKNEKDLFHFWIEQGHANDMTYVNYTFANMGGASVLSDGRVVFTAQSVKSLNENAYNESEEIFLQIFDPHQRLNTPYKSFTTNGTRNGLSGINGTEYVTDYGVQWLTSYDREYEAADVQIATTDDDKIIILYELFKKLDEGKKGTYRDVYYNGKYYKAYEGVYYIVLDKNGNMIRPATLYASSALLDPCEMPICKGNTVYWVGNKADGHFKDYEDGKINTELYIYSLELSSSDEATISDGITDDSIDGLCLYLNGERATDYNDLYEDASLGWRLVQNGRVATDYTGRYDSAKYGSWMIENGKVVSAANNGGDTNVDTNLTGLNQEADGSWSLYNNGQVVSGFTDLYCDSKVGWWLVRNGKVDFGYNGLFCSPTYGWWKINGGAVDFGYTDLYDAPDYGWWKIAGGTVDFGFTGRYDSPTYGAWMIEGGRVTGPADSSGGNGQNTNGLAPASDGTWYLYENGQVASGYNALYYDANYGWWLVLDGRVAFEYNGLYCDPDLGWWLVTGGAVNFDYNDLYGDANYGWWKVSGGAVDFGYTDLFGSPTCGWWLVTGGAVNFGYNDLFGSPQYGWWKVAGGAVDFGFTDLYCSPTCGWWLVNGGAVAFDYTDLFGSPVYGWWKVTGGYVDFGYTGEYDSPRYGRWNIGGGAVIF